MKQKIIFSISIILIILISLSSFSVFATNNDIDSLTSSKISPDLQLKLAEMDSEDTVEVVVWLNNSTDELLENAYKAELQNYIYRGVITTDFLTATNMFDDTSATSEETLSVESTQQLLSIRRSAYSSEIQKNNLAWQTEMFDDLQECSNYIYSSTTAPVIVMNVTKVDIECLIKDATVEGIYLYCANEAIDDDSYTIAESVDSVSSETERYELWQRVANLYELREELGFTGDGIKIGILENNKPNKSSAITLKNKTSSEMIMVNGDYTDSHATFVASILVGESNNYTGVAPDSTLYCATSSVGYINSLDALIGNNINILSISLGLGAVQSGDVISGNFNTYGFYAKFLDYVSYHYGIVVCIAPGNYGESSSSIPSGITEGAMSYNAITVGNVAVSGDYSEPTIELSDSSSYIVGDTNAYKPDLCAPGNGVCTPDGGNSNNGGTSAATPVVAGICALLMEAQPQLIGRPTAVKSIIMSSVNRVTAMGNNYSSATYKPAMSRSYGAGMIDAMNAYNLAVSNGWRCIENQQALASEEPYTMSVSVSQNDIDNSRKIAVCLIWENTITRSDSAGNTITYATTDYSLSLKSPSGSRVAHSYYLYDKKQYIYFKPTVAGTYKIEVKKQVVTVNKTPLAFSYFISN